MNRSHFEAGILVLFALALFGLLGSLFIFDSEESRKIIWPSIVGALMGLATFTSFIAFSKRKIDPTTPTVVASLPDELSANAVVVQLETHGIKARAVGGFTSGFQTEIASDVRVVVAACDIDEATKVLESMESTV